MRVLLIAPLGDDPRYPLYFPSENLGLGYLASYLRERGVDVTLVDANLLRLAACEISSVVNFAEFSLVGISISSHMLVWEALEVARLVRERNENAHITVGGHFATFQDTALLQDHPTIDSVVRGDGEEILWALFSALSSNGDLAACVGLTWRHRDTGVIKKNSASQQLVDLDSLPWPARDTLSILREKGHLWATQISTSRGCFASCSFCDIRAFYGPKWRARSPVDVVDEIEFINERYGSTLFRFSDDEFIGTNNEGRKRARLFAEEIIRRGIEVELMIDARATSVEESLFRLLRKAGAVDCLIGIESGVDRILRMYNKGASVDQNVRAINILKNIGMTLNLAFIMFDPRMTFGELRTNFEFLEHNDITTIDALKSWLWPLHGTPALDQIRELGLITNETIEGVEYRFQDHQVQAAFNFISSFKSISFEIEKRIFLERITPNHDTKRLADAESTLLDIWRIGYETILYDDKVKFDLLLKEMKKETEDISNRWMQ
ncbi:MULTISPECIES: B12-binding domain-containing radical SAM protein [Hyphobacterium]|uniref:B12-binding domain-containing radical SAM protein n=1 Tax=Hyphobacterium vulgare TaxID=1736751 RepID=A0ABV6ZX10_9PROT